jgi:hypothetical protein
MQRKLEKSVEKEKEYFVVTVQVHPTPKVGIGLGGNYIGQSWRAGIHRKRRTIPI